MYKQEKKLVRIDSKKDRILTFHRMQSISQHHNSHYHPTPFLTRIPGYKHCSAVAAVVVKKMCR